MFRNPKIASVLTFVVALEQLLTILCKQSLAQVKMTTERQRRDGSFSGSISGWSCRRTLWPLSIRETGFLANFQILKSAKVSE